MSNANAAPVGDPSSPFERWNSRFGHDHYAYGTEPNGHVVASADRLPAGGRVLEIGSGEGRNAVWLAARGFRVTGIDGSDVGIAKMHKLAASRGVTVESIHADATATDLGAGMWDGIVLVHCHVRPEQRPALMKAIVRALRPGGGLVMEAFTPRQLEYRTGGPPRLEMLYEPNDLREELAGLEFERIEEVTRNVREGKLHTGLAAVVQIVAAKPDPLEAPTD